MKYLAFYEWLNFSIVKECYVLRSKYFLTTKEKHDCCYSSQAKHYTKKYKIGGFSLGKGK